MYVTIAKALWEKFGAEPFGKDDAVVAAWEAFPDRFSLRGHPHPNAVAVLSKFSGRRGLIERGVLRRDSEGVYLIVPQKFRELTRSSRKAKAPEAPAAPVAEPAVAPEPAPTQLPGPAEKIKKGRSKLKAKPPSSPAPEAQEASPPEVLTPPTSIETARAKRKALTPEPPVVAPVVAVEPLVQRPPAKPTALPRLSNDRTVRTMVPWGTSGS